MSNSSISHIEIKILLLQVSSPSHYALWNALSIETLAGDIREEFKKNVNVNLFRIKTENDIDKCIEIIKEFEPNIFGISVEVGSLLLTEKLILKLSGLNLPKANSPLVVFGNKLPTYFPEHFINLLSGSLVVTGEGEESLRGIVEYLLNEKSLESIPNLVYKNQNGELLETKQKAVDLSSLIHPPATDTVPEVVLNNGNALLQSSRGCSWSVCSYCTISSFRKGRKWESLPISRIIQNIEQLVRLGISEFEFADDEFLGGMENENFERAYIITDGIEKIRIDSEAV